METEYIDKNDFLWNHTPVIETNIKRQEQKWMSWIGNQNQQLKFIICEEEKRKMKEIKIR